MNERRPNTTRLATSYCFPCAKSHRDGVCPLTPEEREDAIYARQRRRPPGAPNGRP